MSIILSTEPTPTLQTACELLDELVLNKEFTEFLTVKAYGHLA